MLTTNAKIQLQNKTSVIEVDLHGGAITNFHLKENLINPLSFRFSKEQMPENNKAGAPYRGHFLCAGRWGEPSEGEIKAGIPNHGEPANIHWQLNEKHEKRLSMETTAALEGLQIKRQMELDNEAALCHVTETITNINPLGRLYQMVQHPTIAVPFLNKGTIVNCNATSGFDYKDVDAPVKHNVNWPLVIDRSNKAYDLRNPQQPYNSVFSFIIDPKDNYGWITAYSPAHDLVLGYVWNRNDYPWINLWQHYDAGNITYRGLEFGTTGLHQPFKSIIANNNIAVFGEKAVAFIDAAEHVGRTYSVFLCSVDKGFSGVEGVAFQNGYITLVNTGKRIIVGPLNPGNDHEK